MQIAFRNVSNKYGTCNHYSLLILNKNIQHIFRYPFDTQKCPVELIRPSDFFNQFVMAWSQAPTIQNIKLTQFDTLTNVGYDNTSSSMTLVKVDVILCRRISYYVVSIYIPTFCLFLISIFTLFIDLSHFESTIMVALTGMLVSYTLYQSISEYFPHTSYMKMIDIWLISGLILPFFIISILIIMDFLIMKEKNKVSVIKKKKKIGGLTSKLFLKITQVILPITVGILSVIYWIAGLRHYNFACSIN